MPKTKNVLARMKRVLPADAPRDIPVWTFGGFCFRPELATFFPTSSQGRRSAYFRRRRLTVAAMTSPALLPGTIIRNAFLKLRFEFIEKLLMKPSVPP
jgi:hypothetical protein